MTEETILTTDAAAAHFRNDISGWVSRHGRFYGEDERAARYDGSTHSNCEDCGKVISKIGYTVCPECRGNRDDKRYHKREKKEWDGKFPLYSDSIDVYFWDMGQLEDCMADEGFTLDDLRLLICAPTMFFEISPEDIYCDIMPDDMDIPYGIGKLFDELNADIREYTEPACREPTKYAAIVNV